MLWRRHWLRNFAAVIVGFAQHFKKKSKPIKCSNLQKIVTIARSDGELAQEEIEALYEIAKLIDIKETFIDQTLKFLD